MANCSTPDGSRRSDADVRTDEAIALAFLNSGNKRLESAAWAWANEHHDTVLPGGGGAQWGKA